MKKLKAFFGSQTQFSARILAAALLIGTACAWYAILKPELKIKADESESLRRRIEAAVAPGKQYLGSPVLVRTANNRYLVTIQENQLVHSAYKAELADYLKTLAKQESKAQLDVVYTKSPSLLVKSAVSSLFSSSSAPVIIGIMFLALVRFFFAPISAAAAGIAPYLVALRERQATNRAARTLRREEEAALATAQALLDKEMAELQAEADIAFAAQAATAESQRLAYEAYEAQAAAQELARRAAVVPGTITEFEISASEITFDSDDSADDILQVTSIADILAKVPRAGPRAEVFMAAPLIDTTETEAFVPAAAGGLTFIEEKTADEIVEEQIIAEQKASRLAPLFANLRANVKAKFNHVAETFERRRDRAAVAKRLANLQKVAADSPDALKAEVNRLTSQLNGAKLSWLETA
ncbi:MAG: hypothetical protein EOP05_05085, partial [Proteobacteria bacterium]